MVKKLQLHGSFPTSTIDPTLTKEGQAADAKVVGDELKLLSSAVTSGIPAGGKAGQYLRKKSDADYDVEWADFEIPTEYGLITYNQDKTITIT